MEVQPEFFSGGIKKKQEKRFLKKKSSFVKPEAIFSLSLDNVIVGMIGLLMLNLLFFVFGIERGKYLVKNVADNVNYRCELKSKGKQLAGYKQKIKEVITAKTAAQNEDKPTKSASAAAPKAGKKVCKQKKSKQYTIQLASYVSNRYAKKEAKNLKDKGIKSFVLKKGAYFVVYSDIYNDRKTALYKLDFFKKRYKDCFVKSFKRS